LKLLVSVSRKQGKYPIIAQVVKETGVLVNVERAMIDSHEGELLIDVPDDSCELVRQKIAGLGASVRILDRGIRIDTRECVDCGACISICPQEVFSFGDDWGILVEEEKCVICGKCVIACPHSALFLSGEIPERPF